MLPIILGAVALAGGLYGVKKGVDAKDKSNKAKRVVSRVQENYDTQLEAYNKTKDRTETSLQELGLFKAEIFTTHIKEFVAIVSKCRKTSASYKDIRYFSNDDIKRLDISVQEYEAKISELPKESLASALVPLAAYGTLGATTSGVVASSGMAGISGFTGAGLGLGGITATSGAILGGLVAAPILAIGGAMLDNQAEQKLTDAYAVQKDTNIKIEELKSKSSNLEIVIQRVDELQAAITQLLTRFIEVKDKVVRREHIKPCGSKKYQQLLIIGSALQKLLELAVMDKQGLANTNLAAQIHQILKIKV
jgi:outer membrane lipoprotein SlyB